MTYKVKSKKQVFIAIGYTEQKGNGTYFAAQKASIIMLIRLFLHVIYGYKFTVYTKVNGTGIAGHYHTNKRKMAIMSVLTVALIAIISYIVMGW